MCWIRNIDVRLAAAFYANVLRKKRATDLSRPCEVQREFPAKKRARLHEEGLNKTLFQMPGSPDFSFEPVPLLWFLCPHCNVAMHLPAGTKYSDQPADQRMEFPPVICGEKRRFDQQPSPKRGAWLFVGNRMPASHV